MPKGEIWKKRHNNELRVEQARQMYQDRLDGMTFREIADKHKVSVGTVASRLNSYTPTLLEGPASQYREVELLKLDDWEEELMRLMGKTYYKVDHGKVIMIESAEGEEANLLDEEMKLKIFDRWVKLHEKRVRLQGLEMPTKVETNVTVEVNDHSLVEIIKRKQALNAAEEKALEAGVVDAEIVEDDA